ncbi:unnamed protein product [Blepharisma stoltei]|uniref:Uncharacterized protein n=1 Tax=Blepharisma stoltei TaxID=1481888 RepID=A0AAU9IGF3_9CILI|nr:unnamed protein product [Blepharisma stoltei]
MEERLWNSLKEIAREGSPDTTRARIINKLYKELPSSCFTKPDYIEARKNGLTISESEHALALAKKLKHSGIEEILSCLKTPHQEKVKDFPQKRHKKHKKEPDLRKKKKVGNM